MVSLSTSHEFRHYSVLSTKAPRHCLRVLFTKKNSSMAKIDNIVNDITVTVASLMIYLKVFVFVMVDDLVVEKKC